MVRVCLLILLLAFMSMGLIARPCEAHGWHLNGTFDPCVDHPTRVLSAYTDPQPVQVSSPNNLWDYLSFSLILVPLALVATLGLRQPPLLPPPRLLAPG